MYAPKSFVPDQQKATGYAPKSFIPDPPEKKTIGGFLKNTAKSAGRLVTDTGSAIVNIVNPDMEKNTVANLGKLAVGTAQYLDPTQVLGTQHEDKARAVGNFYKDRYGGMDKIKNTLYNDPVGAVADVAAVATGVGGAVKGSVAAAGKLGAVSKAGRLARVGRVADSVVKVGNTIDPLQAAGRASGAAGSNIFSRIKPGIFSRADDMVTAGIGNPIAQAKAAKKAGRSVSSFMDEYDLYDRSPEKAGNVVKKIGDRYDEVGIKNAKPVEMGKLIQAFDDEIARLEKGVNGVMSGSDRAKVSELIERKDMLIKASGATYHRPMKAPQKLTVQPDGTLQMQNQPIDPALTEEFVSSMPINVGTDALINFRRKVIDPDIPKNMFNLDAKGSGAAQGVKKSRDIIKAGIDSTDPELAKLGLDYGMAKELEKILTSAEARGNNRQLFNFTKLGGAGVGGLISGAPGVIFGFTVEQIVNNPNFIKYASKGLKKALNAQLPKNVGRVGSGLYQTGRAGRTFTSSQMQPKSTNRQTQLPPLANQTIETPY